MKARRKLALLIAGAVAVLAFGSLGLAAIPDENGVIHGCYDTKTGQLRVTNTSVNGPSLSCSNKEAGLEWNQQGPQGIQGVPGPQGAPGPSDAYVELAAPDVTLTGDTVVASLSLPAGKYVVSAKTFLKSSGDTNNLCRLLLPGGKFDWQFAETRGAIGIYHAPITLALPYESATAGQVQLTCSSDQPGVIAKNAFISAIRVGNLTVS